MRTIESFQELFTDSHTLLNFTTNFFKNIGKSVKVDLEKEFEYDVLYGTILIGIEKFLAPYHKESITHKNLLHEMGYDYDKYCSYQTFCLIHELGHKVMGDLYGSSFWKMLLVYNRKVEDNRRAYEFKLINYEELQRNYMQFILEKDANDWAMLFILNNVDIIKQFDKIFMELMKTMLSNRT